MKNFTIRCSSPFLVAQFDAPQAMLSWSLTRPGFTTAHKVAWLYVRNEDLPLSVDPVVLLQQKMNDAGHADAVHLMTSRNVRHHHLAEASAGDAQAACLATVGLGNAVRVGGAPLIGEVVGTINLLVQTSCSLSQGAMVEAVSIAAEARTAAIMDLGWQPRGEIITGTGTDCIVVASPLLGKAENYAGLHTDIGAALGRAVYDAISQGGHVWLAERAKAGHAKY
ncbi:adenosylcobinamide amidohydrolase [Aquamicrobium segne]|uniref:Adenosylcobinamide amidohydrolase n=1 Tax=Aquamicrobium segne TaxID=469547 RepID=A0ABW0GYX7_9HYPH